jgi:hypothetical protein
MVRYDCSSGGARLLLVVVPVVPAVETDAMGTAVIFIGDFDVVV